VYNEGGSSPHLIVADHAGNSIPHLLGHLGVSESEIEHHIGWDMVSPRFAVYWQTRLMQP
jgi:predicted N-formylglutamate amidohydrolase